MAEHYCTYFDGGFAVQGLALWRSLISNDPSAVLWVLALDAEAAAACSRQAHPQLKVTTLEELEQDPELRAAKANRSRIGYYFTLSPVWPRWVLSRRPEVPRVTYLDADLWFFSAPKPIFVAMDEAGASVLVTAHRFPSWLRHYERHGKFNVGVLSFRNDAAGRACLDDWRACCLEWCEDRLENGKYGDQLYLDAWPDRMGKALIVLEHPGVNLAPWNWQRHRVEIGGDRPAVSVNGQPLVVFHFARLRRLGGGWWQSGQLDYGVMPRKLRDAIYGPYIRALAAEEAGLGRSSHTRPRARGNREFLRTLPLRLAFGGDWLETPAGLHNFRMGLGSFSGRVLAGLRKVMGLGEGGSQEAEDRRGRR